MRKILIIASFIPLCFLGCKKDKTIKPSVEDSDKANSIFRVISRSDVKYLISIIEVHPGSPPDTIQNITSNSRSDFDYGFTPKTGSTILVNAIAPNATSLDCTIGYKGVRLGVDSVSTAGKALSVHFEYLIKN